MAIVKCIYCGKQFDRDKQPFVQIPQGQRFRYAHPDCEPDKSKPISYPGEVCYLCGKADGRKTIPFNGESGLRAHPECIEHDNPDEQEKLYRYIMQLYHVKVVPTQILKSIKEYNEQYRYSFRAIRHTLEYWYEIEKNDLAKSNGNIRIVPYIFDRAREYWQKKTKADEVNKDVEVKPMESVKVAIKVPQRQRFHSSSFNFLDEEE